MAGEAAKICLNAIGAQEKHLLSKDSRDGLFYYDPTKLQHSQFRKYHRATNVNRPGSANPNWPFGSTIKVEFDPRNFGDLLTNIWLSIKLPALETGGNYADQIGRALLKSVTMRCDDAVLETIYDDWAVIYDEIYTEMSSKVSNRHLLNRSLAYDTAEDNPSYAEQESEVLIPIPFFFSQNWSTREYDKNKRNTPYFPMASVHRSKVYFEFEFYNQKWFSNTSSTLTLSEFDVITEEISVSPEERFFMASSKRTMLTDMVRRHPDQLVSVDERTVTMNLVPNLPVKTFHWFFRNRAFEQEDVSDDGNPTSDGELYCMNRYNFSRLNDFDQTYTWFAPVMDKAYLFIKGQRLPDVTSPDHSFYKYLTVSHKHMARPVRNIYTYSFATHPLNSTPSGSLAFDTLKGNKTTMEVLIDEAATDSGKSFTMHMYYTAYVVLEFDQGRVRILNADEVEDEEEKQWCPAEPVLGPEKPRTPNVVDQFLAKTSL
jgi:hypothetical protein